MKSSGSPSKKTHTNNSARESPIRSILAQIIPEDEATKLLVD
eukprot:CAMPEP_0185572110 /NCGR_PEP_ID=MMETSP0434-20130131/4080_1 /TAXON_ID=626734 ORGANISM="Favella taraikaensis, Strain Fe Narragansett Bay" /NCGR_SAMPLE_ID=MMETSP0434 /ASSEMBLY_ACC=CAM_ASM_000379 /LENGTH=41 /DNA_ID= /DNA_START= /DNA_END= /DNA_ORIENTATION=